MRFSGIDIKNFRNIGPEGVSLNPLKKCTVLIGQNDAGKSNVLRAVKQILDLLRSSGGKEAPRLSPLDLHNLSGANPFEFTLHFDWENIATDNTLQRTIQTDEFFVTMRIDNTAQRGIVTDYTLAEIQDFQVANATLSALAGKQWTGRIGPDRPDQIRTYFLHEAPNIVPHLMNRFPVVHLLPVFRQILPAEKYSFDGKALVEQLGTWQHPNIGKESERERFERVEEFVRHLLHVPNANLEVDHDKKNIILANDGRRLPLDSHGTGVHEVVIMATAVCSVEDSLVCIEEPEIHLNPRLQREFLEFLLTQSTNRFLVSTHSPTFINVVGDAPTECSLVHLTCTGGVACGKSITEAAEALKVLQDLGIRPSDLLQAASSELRALGRGTQRPRLSKVLARPLRARAQGRSSLSGDVLRGAATVQPECGPGGRT